MEENFSEEMENIIPEIGEIIQQKIGIFWEEEGIKEEVLQIINENFEDIEEDDYKRLVYIFNILFRDYDAEMKLNKFFNDLILYLDRN